MAPVLEVVLVAVVVLLLIAAAVPRPADGYTVPWERIIVSTVGLLLLVKLVRSLLAFFHGAPQ